MTTFALAKILCLASSIFGRPAWEETQCTERAEMILAAAGQHKVDPVLMVAIDLIECDLREVDNPYYKVVRGRKRLAGYDACPMGVRIPGRHNRAKYAPSDLYELSAARMERWLAWCSRSHVGQGHHYISHYNQGNPVYAAQVLGVLEALRGHTAKSNELTDRTRELIRRLAKAFTKERPTS